MHRAGIFRAAIAAAALVTALSAVIGAQANGAQPETAAPRTATTTGSVAGTAWKGDTTPFAHARIRLRNVHDGRGVATTISDVDGRFRFDRVEPAAYVVELLASDDRVLAVGDLFAVSVGVQAVTVVRLSTKTPWHGGFWGNAAAAAIAAASTLGVTANGSNGRPVSPQ
jgi:hypothetical protein